MTSRADSLASVLGDGGGTTGVEARVALAGLRQRMFAAGDAEAVRVGRYAVLAPIGRGGMGVVYRAHDPALDRDVALKLLRGDQGDHERRLRREARAMARLSHPNVVEVLEVGWHEGEAFVVMELVAGRDAAAWLAARPRTWREVLAVFMAAGRGLAAAHAVGLVHRDFKPSNVLVGDDGRVRVTDFGLAASDPRHHESARHGSGDGVGPHDQASTTTASGTRVGTPRYMAPEQRLGGRVDPRADQWAFAVSLWEALYGEHPFLDVATGRIDVARPLPARPGAGRGIASGIARALGRALDPAPERRHPSLDALLARLSAAADRRRLGLPLAVAGTLGLVVVGLASTPSSGPGCDPAAALDQVWSPARRDALARGFAATGLPFAGHAWASVEARVDAWARQWGQAYGSACAAAGDDPDEPAVDVQLACLRGELAELRAVLALLEAPDRELVTRAERATRDLPEPARCSEDRSALAGVDPVTLAEHDERMAEARAHSRAGRFAQARRLGAAAVEAVRDVPHLHARAQYQLGLDENRDGALEAASASLRAAYYGAAATADPDLTARAALGLVTLELRRAAHAQVDEWSRHATTWIERVGDPARRRELRQELAISTGELRYDQGRYDEALAELEALRATIDEETWPSAPRLLNQLGLVHIERGEHEQAAALLVRAAALESRRSGATHPQVAAAISNLGNAHLYRGDYDAAERAYRQAHEIRMASLGPDHPSTATTLLNLGLIADLRGDGPGAVVLLEQAVAGFSASLGPEHPETANALGTLAAMHGNLGQWERCIELHRRAIAIDEATLGPEHPRTAQERSNLASALSEVGRHAEALALQEQALAATLAAHGREHPAYAAGLRERAVLLRRTGDRSGAERSAREALALQERVLGPAHPELGIVLSALADAAVEEQRFDEAAMLAERALAVGPTSAAVRGKAGYLLARALWSAGRDRDRVPGLLDEAERALTEAGPNARHIRQSLVRWRAEALPPAG